MITTVVSRKRWLRGGNVASKLRNAKGKMCCLGFRAKVGGAKVADILALSYPACLLDPFRFFTRAFVNKNGYDTALCIKATEVNDDEKISDSEREKKLRAIFKKMGERIKFVP